MVVNEDYRDVSYKIVNARGHYDAYVDGKFYCSADTFGEALEEIEKLLYGEELM